MVGTSILKRCVRTGLKPDGSISHTSVRRGLALLPLHPCHHCSSFRHVARHVYDNNKPPPRTHHSIYRTNEEDDQDDPYSPATSSSSGSSSPARSPSASVTQRSAGPMGFQRTTVNSTTPVTFWLKYKAEFGQRIRVVGSSEELGAWSQRRGPELTWGPGDMWSVTLELARNQVYEYKYVVLHSDGINAVAWQFGNNAVLAVQDEGVLEVFDQWMDGPSSAVVYNGDKTTRSERLNKWAESLRNANAMQRAELRNIRMDLFQVQEEARAMREENRSLKSQLTQALDANRDLKTQLDDMEERDKELRLQLLESQAMFQEVMSQAREMLMSSVEDEFGEESAYDEYSGSLDEDDGDDDRDGPGTGPGAFGDGPSEASFEEDRSSTSDRRAGDADEGDVESMHGSWSSTWGAALRKSLTHESSDDDEHADSSGQVKAQAAGPDELAGPARSDDSYRSAAELQYERTYSTSARRQSPTPYRAHLPQDREDREDADHSAVERSSDTDASLSGSLASAQELLQVLDKLEDDVTSGQDTIARATSRHQPRRSWGGSAASLSAPMQKHLASRLDGTGYGSIRVIHEAKDSLFKGRRLCSGAGSSTACQASR